MEEVKKDDYFIQFLLISTIPKNKKGNNRVYDAVYKAHRDVLTGRFHLPQYCRRVKYYPNDPLEVLYNLIMDTKLKGKDNKPIGSRVLIQTMIEKFPMVEFGAIQKLVNMTLKYLLILSKYDNSMVWSDFMIDLTLYDCPLDSNIMGTLKNDYIPWTKLDIGEYIRVQKEISRILQINKYSDGNIQYDFIKWNN